MPVEIAVRRRILLVLAATQHVSGAVGGIAAGLVVAGVSYAALGVAAAVLVVPYLLGAGAAGMRRPSPAT